MSPSTSAPLTPISVDPAALTPRPSYRVLLTDTPSLQEIRSHLHGIFGDRLATQLDEHPGLGCVLDEQVRYALSTHSASNYPTPHLHAVLGPQRTLADAASVLEVGVHSDVRPLLSHRENVRELNYMHAELAAAVAARPDALAVCHAFRGASRPFALDPLVFIEAVRHDVVSGYVVDVVVTRTATGAQGMSIGMVEAGHPELQLHSTASPSEVYNVMTDVCQWALTHQPIASGDTLEVHGQHLRAQQASWMGGHRPALELVVDSPKNGGRGKAAE
ncbi:hypothetical protein CCICO_02970 [Corynebacterium ciconiae DSM 44920]|uniref:hypothetical protein n=1 Tax=Corynebacterium ciconiae TaxID=227319 RepID=UPI00036D92CD|nr:hypothetical protein [Corynebacterium ciconiae]WKD60639.1 hypothetical protein CCICO_02970 [Corynebacterium ciconiae DSM 44920]